MLPDIDFIYFPEYPMRTTIGRVPSSDLTSSKATNIDLLRIGQKYIAYKKSDLTLKQQSHFWDHTYRRQTPSSEYLSTSRNTDTLKTAETEYHIE